PFEHLLASTELQRRTNEAHALTRAEKTLDRVQQEALAVSDRLALLANVMNGSALLIVPASKSETDPWVVPPEFSRYYSETQFAPIQIELQTTATSYAQADRFNFSRAASRLRESLRALSPSIYPQERQLRLEYFYNHFEAFYRAIWFYGLAFVILLVAHARGGIFPHAVLVQQDAAPVEADDVDHGLRRLLEEARRVGRALQHLHRRLQPSDHLLHLVVGVERFADDVAD